MFRRSSVIAMRFFRLSWPLCFVCFSSACLPNPLALHNSSLSPKRSRAQRLLRFDKRSVDGAAVSNRVDWPRGENSLRASGRTCDGDGCVPRRPLDQVALNNFWCKSDVKIDFHTHLLQFVASYPSTRNEQEIFLWQFRPRITTQTTR